MCKLASFCEYHLGMLNASSTPEHKLVCVDWSGCQVTAVCWLQSKQMHAIDLMFHVLQANLMVHSTLAHVPTTAANIVGRRMSPFVYCRVRPRERTLRIDRVRCCVSPRSQAGPHNHPSVDVGALVGACDDPVPGTDMIT